MIRSCGLSSCVIVLATLLNFHASYAFDIAIYFDARSGVNWRSQSPESLFCGGEADSGSTRQVALGNIESEQAAFDRFSELSVSHVITLYPFVSDFTDLHSRQLHGMKILNWSYPGEAFKYMDSQDRKIDVWDLRDMQYVHGYASSWDSAAYVAYDDSLRLDVLQMRQSNAETMWKPESNMGVMSGWNRAEARISDSVYMPMHFQIICNLEPTDPPPEDHVPIATFYWIVRAYDGDGNPNGWWRYPGWALRAGDFSDPTRLDTLHHTINPSPQAGGTFTFLNDDFSPTTVTSQSHSYGNGSLDDAPPSRAFGASVPVRMWIYYQGNNQTFQVRNVSLWDEGFDRLMLSPDSSTWRTNLGTAFYNQYHNAGDSLFAGWYYDEWPQGPDMLQMEMLRPWTIVNKIMRDNGPAAIFLNGQFGWRGCPICYSNPLFRLEYDYGVHCPVHMEEFYLYGGLTGCVANVRDAWTDSSSDVPYWHTIQLCNASDSSVIGERSLQCSIDQHLWGDSVLIDQFQPGVTTQWEGMKFGLVDEIAFVRDSSGGSKFWAMIQGGEACALSDGNCLNRLPTPNECKLSAWLAVAADADGILWYPVQLGGGLLKWSNDHADWCHNPDGLAHTSSSVETTERFEAARKVDGDILKITPILESLDFVKTYCSRAFERNYPDDQDPYYALPAIWLDTLARVPWEHHSYRCVESITTWAPAAYNQDGSVARWADQPEQNSYVEISRFKTKAVSATAEDYWFLIVNRRALPHEFRKIRLLIETDTTVTCYPYWADYVLGDSAKVTVGPYRANCQPKRNLDIVLAPAEAELIHFYRGEFGCDSTYAHIGNLTAIRDGDHAIRLEWQPIDTTDDGAAFRADTFFVSGSPRFDGPFSPIGYTDTTVYVDSAFYTYPKYFYQVQACGEIIEGKTAGLKGTRTKISVKTTTVTPAAVKTRVATPVARNGSTTD